MAKFELPIYNENDEVIKTVKRNFIPVDLFIRFQQLAEKIAGEKFKNDKEMFAEIQKLFLEAFPALTADEFKNNIDLAQILYTINDIVSRAAKFEGSSKNV